MEATVERLSALDDAALDSPSGHPCAMGGTLRKLLVHNVAHDRMHLGQIHGKRYELDVLQESELARLLAENLVARAEIIASLIDLPDDALDRRPVDGATETTIREVVEHVLYWEKDSVDHTVAAVEPS
jgi:uncharacterized damage-inducible protein DinB